VQQTTTEWRFQDWFRDSTAEWHSDGKPFSPFKDLGYYLALSPTLVSPAMIRADLREFRALAACRTTTDVKLDSTNTVSFNFTCGDSVLKAPVAYRALLFTAADGLILGSSNYPGEGFFLSRGYWRPPTISMRF